MVNVEGDAIEADAEAQHVERRHSSPVDARVEKQSDDLFADTGYGQSQAAIYEGKENP